MKLNRQQQKSIQLKIENKILNSTLGDDKKNLFNQLKPYYMHLLSNEYDFFDIIPALSYEQIDALKLKFNHCYYSCPIENVETRFIVKGEYDIEHDVKIDRVSPIFKSLSSHTRLFDAEQYLLEKSIVAKDLQEFIDSHPFQLFFFGGDDGHLRMRFKDEHEAKKFLQKYDYFDQIFNQDTTSIQEIIDLKKNNISMNVSELFENVLWFDN